MIYTNKIILSKILGFILIDFNKDFKIKITINPATKYNHKSEIFVLSSKNDIKFSFIVIVLSKYELPVTVSYNRQLRVNIRRLFGLAQVLAIPSGFGLSRICRKCSYKLLYAGFYFRSNFNSILFHKSFWSEFRICFFNSKSIFSICSINSFKRTLSEISLWSMTF